MIDDYSSNQFLLSFASITIAEARSIKLTLTRTIRIVIPKPQVVIVLFEISALTRAFWHWRRGGDGGGGACGCGWFWIGEFPKVAWRGKTVMRGSELELELTVGTDYFRTTFSRNFLD